MNQVNLIINHTYRLYDAIIQPIQTGFSIIHMGQPKITLEQWAALKAVVDEGSFAKAAEALDKSQSSVSYLVARLNDQLPTPALVPHGRKTRLTELGQTLYRHAANLLQLANTCEAIAQRASQGWESALSLACDALTPMQPVMCALQAFSKDTPHTRVKILETTLSGTDEAILQRQCNLAIAVRTPPGFLSTQLTQISMVAVAHVNHPLSQLPIVTEPELKTHRQIVVRDTGVKRQQDAGWLGADQRWAVSHFSTSVEMVCSGLGFAFLPLHRVKPYLTNGTLAKLNLNFGAERTLLLSLVHFDAETWGPAAIALQDHLVRAFKE